MPFLRSKPQSPEQAAALVTRNVASTLRAGTTHGALSASAQAQLLVWIHIELAAGEAARRGPFEKGRPFSSSEPWKGWFANTEQMELPMIVTSFRNDRL